jgi:cytochrome c oxidase assembly protein subunit 15
MPHRSVKQKSFSYKLAMFAVAFAAVVVLLGAYTRLVDAGLGCPDWPGCYGFIDVPDTPVEIKQAEEAFPDSPVEAHKAWPEMIHRYFAGTLGLLIAALAIIALLKRKQSGQPVVLPQILLGLVIFQAALGMWTVTMGLLPVVVMGHLLGGFATLALLLLLFLKLRDDNKPAYASSVRTFALLTLLIVFAQITLGGWTSANYAAIICTDFPTCQGALIPPLDFVDAFKIETQGVTNYLGGHLDNDARVTIHWMHRLGALIATLFVVLLFLKLMRSGTKKLAWWLLTVLAVQVSLGISNVVLSLPLPVAVAHNGVAALLLLSLVYTVHQLGQRD